MAKSKKTTAVSHRVFLVVVDATEELHQALYYACKRASHLDGRIALLYSIPPTEFQHWAGVGELMRDEARAEAEVLLNANGEYVNELTGTLPLMYLREGYPQVEIIKLINEESQISMLILGANTNDENAGPLVNYMTTKGAAECRVPITIVPGNLSDDDIDLLT